MDSPIFVYLDLVTPTVSDAIWAAPAAGAEPRTIMLTRGERDYLRASLNHFVQVQGARIFGVWGDLALGVAQEAIDAAIRAGDRRREERAIFMHGAILRQQREDGGSLPLALPAPTEEADKLREDLADARKELGDLESKLRGVRAEAADLREVSGGQARAMESFRDRLAVALGCERKALWILVQEAAGIIEGRNRREEAIQSVRAGVMSVNDARAYAGLAPLVAANILQTEEGEDIKALRERCAKAEESHTLTARRVARLEDSIEAASKTLTRALWPGSECPMCLPLDEVAGDAAMWIRSRMAERAQAERMLAESRTPAPVPRPARCARIDWLAIGSKVAEIGGMLFLVAFGGACILGGAGVVTAFLRHALFGAR